MLMRRPPLRSSAPCSSISESVRDRLDGETEIIRDVAPGHRQGEGAGPAEALIHLDQERGDAFLRRAAPEKDGEVLGMAQFGRRPGPELTGDFGEAGGGTFDLTALEDQDPRLGQGLGRVPVGRSRPNRSPGRWNPVICRRPSFRML